MTKNTPARLSAIQAPVDAAVASGDATGDADVLERMRDAVLGLLAGLDRPPRALRVKAHRVEIEVEWPEQVVPVAPVLQVAPEAPAAAAAAPAGPEAATGQYLTAHSVGVFYRAPEPGAKPFVDAGDVVTPGQQIGIIEAMKLMMPVEADVAGRIVEVLASDGQPVEYGDRLFAIEPAGS
jgi:acetyl-CoA carboxylase biotin carboxyl carrier protein